MSRLFGSRGGESERDSGQPPLLSELVPEIEAITVRLSALPLPQLAAEILTTAFDREYYRNGVSTLGSIAEALMPPHSDPRIPVPNSTTDAEFDFRNLVAEGVQLLVQARLVMSYQQEFANHDVADGYATTRLGRTALVDGSFRDILAATVPPQ